MGSIATKLTPNPDSIKVVGADSYHANMWELDVIAENAGRVIVLEDLPLSGGVTRAIFVDTTGRSSLSPPYFFHGTLVYMGESNDRLHIEAWPHNGVTQLSLGTCHLLTIRIRTIY